MSTKRSQSRSPTNLYTISNMATNFSKAETPSNMNEAKKITHPQILEQRNERQILFEAKTMLNQMPRIESHKEMYSVIDAHKDEA